MPLRQILNCPYCPRRATGVIAVDLDAIVALQAPVVDGGYHWFDAPTPRPAVIFNPDGFPNRPCPHLLSCYFDAHAVMRGPGGDDAERLDFSGGYNHDWLKKNDPDDELNIYLWTDLDDGVDDAFDPATPYVRRRVERHYRRVRGRPAISATGAFILATEPLRFLEELRSGYQARSVT